MKIIDSIIDLLFPRKCICCNKLVKDEFICEKCHQLYVSDKIVAQLGRLTVYAPYKYHGALRKFFNKYKFRGAKTTFHIFTYYMLKTLEAHCEEKFDLVTFVPMPKERKRGRGYNQAEILAQDIAHQLGIPCCDCSLSKEFLFAQHEFGKKIRAYSGEKLSIGDWQGESQNVLLVDDLYTTGSTLISCAKLLKSKGAKRIVALTFASS